MATSMLCCKPVGMHQKTCNRGRPLENLLCLHVCVSVPPLLRCPILNIHSLNHTRQQLPPTFSSSLPFPVPSAHTKFFEKFGNFLGLCYNRYYGRAEYTSRRSSEYVRSTPQVDEPLLGRSEATANYSEPAVALEGSRAANFAGDPQEASREKSGAVQLQKLYRHLKCLYASYYRYQEWSYR